MKKPLASLKTKDIENIAGYTANREPEFYQALKKRLAEFNDDPKKAFAEPFYKPTKNGEQGPLVKSVRVEDDRVKVGLAVRHGITDTNGDMVRADVYQKANKSGRIQYFVVPVYAWQIAKGVLPLLDCRGYKIDETYT
ncbi:type II CRISPR RNA-guided endonuclease Cas9, partial [Bacillus stratosphericus]